MLRVALHAVVCWSLIAAPAEAAPVRDYAGDEAVVTESEEAPSASVVPEPPPVAAEPQPVAAEPVTAAPEGPIDDAADDEVDVPYDPLRDSPEAIRARSWVRSGAVFMVIGGVLSIGAIAMSTAKVNTMEDQNACNTRGDVAGNGCLAEARQRAVLALALPGGLLLAGGIAMLATGKVQQRRLRASLRASRRELMLGLQLAF